MKQTLLFLSFLFIMLSANAQQDKMYISVVGTCEYKPKITFKVSNLLSLNNIYQDTRRTFEDYKKEYLDLLAQEGIGKDEITENELAYALLNYPKEGTVIDFSSTSVEKTQKFLETNTSAVSKYESTYIVEMTEEDMNDFFKEAYNNAKQKAEQKAKKIGRKIGQAIAIVDHNNSEYYASLYSTKDLQKVEYRITVSFELL